MRFSVEKAESKMVELIDRVQRGEQVIIEQGDKPAEICQLAGLMDWDHRDPSDRMIAATSIYLKLPLISADKAFDSLASREDWPGRVW